MYKLLQKGVDKMVKKWQAYYKEANGTDSSDDEPITKYVKNYDSGIDLSDDVKESIRKEVTRALGYKTINSKKKKTLSRKRPSDTSKSSKMQKQETIGLTDLFVNATEMVFADVNEIHSVGSSQQLDIKNELPISFEPSIGLYEYL